MNRIEDNFDADFVPMNQDRLRQAFNELFDPLINGKPIFLEVNSQIPSTATGPFFNRLIELGNYLNLITVFIDLGYSKLNNPEKNHEKFVKGLKSFTRQARKKPMLLLIRRFDELQSENNEIYKKCFLDLISAKKPVGVIIQTTGKPFIVSTELTRLGDVFPKVISIQKAIDPRNSSYIPR